MIGTLYTNISYVISWERGFLAQGGKEGEKLLGKLYRPRHIFLMATIHMTTLYIRTKVYNMENGQDKSNVVLMFNTMTRLYLLEIDKHKYMRIT